MISQLLIPRLTPGNFTNCSIVVGADGRIQSIGSGSGGGGGGYDTIQNAGDPPLAQESVLEISTGLVADPDTGKTVLYVDPILIAAVANAVPSTRTISAGTGLSGGGDLSTNRSIALADTAVVANTYNTPQSFTVDAQGRLTNVTAGVITQGVATATVAGSVLFDNTSRSVGSRVNYASNVFAQFVGLIGSSPSNYISFSSSVEYLYITAGKTLEIDSTRLTFNGPAQLAGHVTSGTSNTYDLGSSSDIWRAAYVGTLTTTGAITLPVGAAATPSLNFTGATTTGLFGIVSGGVVGIASAGVESARFSGLRLALGVTGAPTATLHLKTESEPGASFAPVIVDKTVATPITNNYLMQFKLNGTEKGKIVLESTNQVQIWGLTAAAGCAILDSSGTIFAAVDGTNGVRLTCVNGSYIITSSSQTVTISGNSTGSWNASGVVVAPAALSNPTGSGTALKLTAAAHTGFATTTEHIFLDVGGAAWNWTWAAGTTALQRFSYFRKPTMVTGGATRSATVTIQDAPGGTITDPLAFLIEAGSMRSLAGDIYLDAGSFQSTSGGAGSSGKHFEAYNNAALLGETAQPDAPAFTAYRGTSKRWALGLEGGGSTAGPFFLDVSDGTTSERIIRGKYVTADGSYLRLGATTTKLGYFGVDGALRQGSFTTHAGTLSTDLPATPTAQQVGDCLRQLISFLGTTAGYGLVVADQ